MEAAYKYFLKASLPTTCHTDIHLAYYFDTCVVRRRTDASRNDRWLRKDEAARLTEGARVCVFFIFQKLNKQDWREIVEWTAIRLFYFLSFL
jgi:hypothetical protein